MLASTAKGNVRSCAVAPTCQLWLGNAVSGLGSPYRVPLCRPTSDTPQQDRIFSNGSQNIDGTNRTARQLEASMPPNTVMPIDLAWRRPSAPIYLGPLAIHCRR